MRPYCAISETMYDIRLQPADLGINEAGTSSRCSSKVPFTKPGSRIATFAISMSPQGRDINATVPATLSAFGHLAAENFAAFFDEPSGKLATGRLSDDQDRTTLQNLFPFLVVITFTSTFHISTISCSKYGRTAHAFDSGIASTGRCPSKGAKVSIKAQASAKSPSARPFVSAISDTPLHFATQNFVTEDGTLSRNSHFSVRF